jgi:uncharacterized membrane protein YedE/YeeE
MVFVSTMSSRPATDQGAARQAHHQTAGALLAYFLLGICFGFTLTQSEVLSWFRIQEMFRFQSPRMYEIITSAVVVAAIAVALIKRLHLRALSGEPISIPPKSLGCGVRYAVGGTIFGLGWALTGACPGPLFALVGNGVTVMIVAIASALAGTWLYGLLRPKLPH